MADDLGTRIMNGLVSRDAAIQAARLGDEAALGVSPGVESAQDLYELADDVREQRFSWNDKESCVRAAIAAARFCLLSCRKLLPDLEASAATAAIAAAESWCLSAWSDTAAAVRESARTCSLLIEGVPGSDLVSGVVGAVGSAAEAAAATQEPIWKGACAAAMGEALSVVQINAGQDLLRTHGPALTEEEKERMGDLVDKEMLAAVRSEVVPWLLALYDPFELARGDL